MSLIAWASYFEAKRKKEASGNRKHGKRWREGEAIDKRNLSRKVWLACNAQIWV